MRYYGDPVVDYVQQHTVQCSCEVICRHFNISLHHSLETWEVAQSLPESSCFSVMGGLIIPFVTGSVSTVCYIMIQLCQIPLYWGIWCCPGKVHHNYFWSQLIAVIFHSLLWCLAQGCHTRCQTVVAQET